MKLKKFTFRIRDDLYFEIIKASEGKNISSSGAASELIEKVVYTYPYQEN